MELGTLLRALRRHADLSQRELAARAGVPQATVARIESGRAGNPGFRTVRRLVVAAGGRVTIGVTDAAAEPTGAVAVQPIPHETRRDEAGRHYPAHLDVRDVHEPKDWAGAWWAYWYNLPPERWPLRLPAATYDLSRERRNLRRWQTEVRRTVRIRRVTEDLPAGGWQWVAELPDGGLVGELRAHERGPRPLELDPIGAATAGPVEDPAERTTGREPPDRGELVLDGVVVAPRYRGMGLGRRLVEALVAEADRLELPAIHATAEDVGIPFLSGCGFRFAGPQPVALTRRRSRGSWGRDDRSGRDDSGG